MNNMIIDIENPEGNEIIRTCSGITIKIPSNTFLITYDTRNYEIVITPSDKKCTTKITETEIRIK